MYSLYSTLCFEIFLLCYLLSNISMVTFIYANSIVNSVKNNLLPFIHVCKSYKDSILFSISHQVICLLSMDTQLHPIYFGSVCMSELSLFCLYVHHRYLEYDFGILTSDSFQYFSKVIFLIYAMIYFSIILRGIDYGHFMV